MSATQLAEQIARKFHAGQKYGDEEYVVHLQEVVAAVQHFFPGDERLIVLAWLHDIIEDTTMTVEVLRVLFDGDICDAIIAMTHRKGEDRASYLERVRANGLARSGKLCDSYCNLSRSLARADMKRVKKYGEYIAFLASP